MSFINSFNYKKFILNPIITEGKPGELVDLDINKICLENNINFSISKCFYVNELNSNLSRGNHSNENASELLVCMNGSFIIKLHDGENEEMFEIKKNQAIFINNNIWIEIFNFKNCIMGFVNILKNNKKSCYDFNEFIRNKKI
jgi:dTDP-4-dehydrorhamnose 3,5-epimerase-like enzyme